MRILSFKTNDADAIRQVRSAMEATNSSMPQEYVISVFLTTGEECRLEKSGGVITQHTRRPGQVVTPSEAAAIPQYRPCVIL